MNEIISICSKEVRVLDDLYSLNDLHKAGGGEKRHAPSRFVRNDQTKALIAEIDRDPNMGLAIKTVHGGPDSGTYACKELIYAYAMWIIPKFHLHVIRAFDEIQAKELSGPRRPQVNDTERYALANTIIDQLKLDGTPVLIPYIELVNLISVTRHYQETIERLSEMKNRVDDGIATFMRASSRHFGEQ